MKPQTNRGMTEVDVMIGVYLLIGVFGIVMYLTHPFSSPPSTNTEQSATSTPKEICQFSSIVGKICGTSDEEINKKWDIKYAELIKERQNEQYKIKLRCQPYANTPPSQVPLKDSKVCQEFFNN